jgi:hypothetical protein
VRELTSISNVNVTLPVPATAVDVLTGVVLIVLRAMIKVPFVVRGYGVGFIPSPDDQYNDFFRHIKKKNGLVHHA